MSLDAVVPWFWLPTASVAASWGESGPDLDMVLLHYIAQGRRGAVIIGHPDGHATRRDGLPLPKDTGTM